MKRLLSLLALALGFPASHGIAAGRPNVLWFVVDDMSANFSCYGEKLIQTPHVDRLAAEGTRFSRAFVTAPVCSPCRSALITGMYQTTIGAHHHRSGRGVEKIHLPEGVVPVPVLFQQAGYYTCIGSGLPAPTVRARQGRTARRTRLGKTDYNFEWDPKIYDGNDWSGRKPDQPFFMQVQLAGGKLRGGTDDKREQLLGACRSGTRPATDPDEGHAAALLPARSRCCCATGPPISMPCRFTDQHVGEVVARLEQEGILDQTLIIFMTDHGISHARGKQFLYDEGTHIPFVVRGPGIDRRQWCATIWSSTSTWRRFRSPRRASRSPRRCRAGTSLPRTTSRATPCLPRATVATRPSSDIRSVRTDRYLYIRNFLSRSAASAAERLQGRQVHRAKPPRAA